MEDNFESSLDADNKSDYKRGVRYSCFVDHEEGEKPWRCVIDVDQPSSCDFGILPSGRERKSKWTCPHWKPLDKTLAALSLAS
jgi:hypothetical protein